MNRKINLFWCQYNEGHGNFGDELNPYLIKKLSGKKVSRVDPYEFSANYWSALKSIVYKIVRGNVGDIFKLPEWNTIFKRKIVFSIGSILNSYKTNNITVWGSGIISKNDEIYPADFLAVRGKYSQKRLGELGYKAPEIIGDPALLLPLVLSPSGNKKYQLTIIPHFIHYEKLRLKYKGTGVLVINLLDEIEKIIKEITSSELTLSTSLHGIIVSHAYKIPSLWVKFEDVAEIKLTGDDIKFQDYFSSVQITEYFPPEIKDTDRFNDSYILNLKQGFKEFLLPDVNRILQIQKDLLSVAPFPLLPKFKN